MQLKLMKEGNEYLYKIERGNFTLRKYSEHIHRFLKVEFHTKEYARIAIYSNCNIYI